LKRSTRVSLLALSFSLLLSGAVLALEVGHVSESFQETMSANVSIPLGEAEPLPSTDPLVSQPISLDGSWTILGAFSADSAGSALAGTLSDDTGATNLLAYNFVTNQWDEAPTGVVTTAAGGSFPFFIQDNSPYDQEITSGDITAYFMAVKPLETPVSGGGGGGCSAAFLAPAALFLLAPLFLLRKRG
jgi:Synergist-CTERM protein sorting domain-containing protein